MNTMLRIFVFTGGLLITSMLMAQTNAAPPEMKTVVSKTSAVQKSIVTKESEKEVQKKLEEKVKQIEERANNAILEGQRKSVDWWFAALAIMTTIVAALGALLPYLMGRKDKELLQSELKNARDLVESIKDTKQKGEGIVDEIRKFQSGTDQTPKEKNVVTQEATDITKNPNATEVDKLRARAVLASQIETPTEQQIEEAYKLWSALSVLQEADASAHFNAGYWAQQLYKSNPKINTGYWLLKVKEEYGKALALNPDMHAATNNLGIALNAEAKELVQRGDLSGARSLWAQAGEKYEKAFNFKKGKHEVANNWGIALAAEAKALADNGDLSSALMLWSKAGEKYESALEIKPDKFTTVKNWSSALNAQAKALADSGDNASANLLRAKATEKIAQAKEMQEKKDGIE